MNLPIGRFLGKGMHGHCDKVRKLCEDKFGGPAAVDELFPASAYQLTHNALFPHDCMHIENLGGDIDLPELQNKRLTLGCFPWKFKAAKPRFAAWWPSLKSDSSGDLALLPATEQRRLAGEGEVSARELVAAALARVERLGPQLNAVITLNPRAMEDARALDDKAARGETLGLLHGLPVGIKDVTEVGGLRTTYGSPLYADNVPAEDALVVERLRAAGAVILGKTNTPEFATGGNTFNEVFGRTRNPWNPEKSAGGSTGGGAAALATGQIALAEGTDLGGSLRIPAAFCGVVGLQAEPRFRAYRAVELPVGQLPGHRRHGQKRRRPRADAASGRRPQ